MHTVQSDVKRAARPCLCVRCALDARTSQLSWAQMWVGAFKARVSESVTSLHRWETPGRHEPHGAATGTRRVRAHRPVCITVSGTHLHEERGRGLREGVAAEADLTEGRPCVRLKHRRHRELPARAPAPVRLPQHHRQLFGRATARDEQRIGNNGRPIEPAWCGCTWRPTSACGVCAGGPHWRTCSWRKRPTRRARRAQRRRVKATCMAERCNRHVECSERV